jgi:hypothetical protein
MLFSEHSCYFRLASKLQRQQSREISFFTLGWLGFSLPE